MITIRNATLDDLNIIRSLAYEIWPVVYRDIISAAQIEYMLEKAYSVDSLNEQFTKRKHRFILIEENGKTLGFASFGVKNEEQKNIFRLHKLYLALHQHGKGLGKMLVDKTAAEALAAGAEYLELNVNRNNPTVSFYRKLGFVIDKEINESIGNGFWVEDYIMILPVGNRVDGARVQKQ